TSSIFRLRNDDGPTVDPSLPDCIVLLASIPLAVLFLFAVIPALIRSFSLARRKVSFSEEEETRPLLGPERASVHPTSRLSRFEREWELASPRSGEVDQDVEARAQPSVFYWELVKELNDTSDGDWIASLLFVTQMVVALLLFVYAAKTVTPKPNDSSMFIEFQKRHNRTILFRLAVFHVISASMWNFVAIAAYPLWQKGELSTRFFVLVLSMLVGGYVMAMIWRIHRLKVDGKIPSPELDASLISRLTFSWFDPMMAYGYKHELKFDDLYDINPSENIDTNLSLYHQIQRRCPTPLLKSLWIMNWVYMTQQFGLVLLSTMLYFSGPFFLNRILNHLTNRGKPDQEPEWLAYVYVVGILVTSLTRFALEGQISLTARKLGLRIRNTLSGLVYRKSLRRVPKLAMDDERAAKKTGEQQDNAGASVGKIVNLMSVDAGNVGEWSGSLYTPLITFIQIVLCVLSLVYILGWPAIAGVILMVLFMFSGAPLASTINTASYTLKRNKDERVNSMNELLQGIKIIKLFAWEKQFEKRVSARRETELNSFYKLIMLYAFNRVLWYSAPIMTTFVTLGTYTKIAGHDLDATTAFTALALFNLLRGPLQLFPDTLVNLLDVWVSVKRIKSFLNEEDLERFGENEAFTNDANELRLSNNATFEWADAEKNSDAITAPTGNFFSRTWKLLFGKREVASTAVATEPPAEAESSFKLMDMNVEFPSGDLTVVIGATGAGKTSLLLSLLGETRRLTGTRTCPNSVAYVSQTAWLTNATIRQNILFGTPWDPVRYRRVIQACALVKDFEVLEGGDLTEVGEKGINLSGGQKQRISLARAAYSQSQFVVLDDPLSAVDAPTARISLRSVSWILSGRTRVLVTNAVGLAIPAATITFYITSKDSAFTSTPFSDGLAEMAELVLAERRKYLSNEKTLDADVDAPEYTVEKSEGGTKLTEDEKMETGNVKMKVYSLYMNSMGGIPYLAILLGGYIINHCLATMQDVVISWWSNQYVGNSTTALGTYGYTAQDFSTSQEWHYRPGRGTAITNYYLSLYGIYLYSLMILNFGIIRAARAIHEAMLKKVLRAPLRFFEVTPLGRVMNRFTKDLSSVDWEVGNSTGSLVFFIVQCAIVIGTVSTVLPALFLFLIPLCYVYIRIGQYYIRTSRSLKRIDSVARSPIFSHFSETLNGVTTIRAFNELTRFTEEIGGLCLNFTLTLTDTLIALVRVQSWMEMSMNSIERCDEYIHLEEEAEDIVLDFNSNLQMRYSPDTPVVLHGVDAEIGAREKVGVVGRTGAGKSTLTLAMFRIVEPCGGRIVIDGVDISGIGLDDLRGALTIIPQDPVLFAGTVRSNIDPFETISDAELWAALKRAHLVPSNGDRVRGTSSSSPATVVVEDDDATANQGSAKIADNEFTLNLDSPILKEVIMLDEATASVDTETDSRIQSTIRTEFAGSTLLVIAHRLRTIIDYDRIIVLDHGKVIENGSPLELIERKDGAFRKMCEETGEFDELVAIAKTAALNARN
ncbi:P-loop containing nucleoside triphosphate hydrolase protein, partial [Rhizoclosmatium globosum]